MPEAGSDFSCGGAFLPPCGVVLLVPCLRSDDAARRGVAERLRAGIQLELLSDLESVKGRRKENYVSSVFSG
jgi:hypothetical protein